MVPFVILFFFKWFYIKPTTAHNPVIQMKMDELLSIHATEPPIGVADFYSNVFIVPT